MENHELIAYLDKRFTENARQFDDRFTEYARQIDERFTENARQIDERFAENARQIDERFAENARQIDERFAKSARQIEQFREETNTRFERLDERVHHTQIEVEGSRGDTRLIAEKVGTLDDKMDGVRSELKAEIGDVKSLLVHSYRDHDSRIRDLESRVKKRASGKSRPQVE